MKPAIVHALFLLLLALVAASGALFTPGEWYAALEKPAWTPPDAVFAPVWTLIYILVAVAGARAWLRTAPGQRLLPFSAYAAQLLLNAGWSALFFGMRAPGLALLELAGLWIAIALTLYLFARVDRIAAWLLAPYLAWTSFAGGLNAAIVMLN